MADPILLEVLTPERKVLATRASDVQFATLHRGTYGILPDHTPVMTPLGDGLLTYTREAKPHRLAIFGGFAEVGPDHVTILAREADTPESLDPARLQGDKARALQLLREAKDPEALREAQVLLDATTLRLQVLGS